MTKQKLFMWIFWVNIIKFYFKHYHFQALRQTMIIKTDFMHQVSRFIIHLTIIILKNIFEIPISNYFSKEF